MSEMKRTVQRLPKAELHVHLRGAAPVELFTELLNKHSVERMLRHAPRRQKAWFEQQENVRPFLGGRRYSVELVSRLFCYRDFSQFLAAYCFTGYLVRDASDLRRLITSVVERLKEQRVVYAEITFSAMEYLRQGILADTIGACLGEAAEAPGIRVQWIIDLVRDIGHFRALSLLNAIADWGWPNVVGITLGGSESLFPPAKFAKVYSTARQRGLRLTVHAGEMLGAQSVWDALRILGAERIGHGLRAVEDPALVNYLAARNVPLEVCPTSNVRTGLCPSYEDHPVRTLFEAGVPITVNSDDPTFFGTTLADEYAHVYAAGVPAEGILGMLTNGFKYSFLSQDKVQGYTEQLENQWENLQPKACHD